MIPKRSIALGLATALVLAGGAVAATGSGKGVDESHTLTGTWLATVDRGPAGPLKSLQTYARSGVFTETSNVVPSGLRGPGHGSWSQADHHAYDTTELFLRYDPGTGKLGRLPQAAIEDSAQPRRRLVHVGGREAGA